MSYNVRKFAVFVSSILISLVVRCPAADQPTVLVVAQDGAELFYHRNGKPTDIEVVPKGTELTIESTSGERCFVTYKGKPAYIRQQFLATKQEFLKAQAALGQEQKTNSVSELATATQGQAAPVGPIGYAWPKTDLLITNPTPLTFKPLKNGGTYPLLVKLESGYSIVCEGVDGQKDAAFLPLKDRFGGVVSIQTVSNGVSVSDQYARFKDDNLMVDLKPGIIPVHSGVRYSVLNKSNGILSVECTFPELTQTVEIADDTVDVLSSSEYKKGIEAVLDKLKKEADEAIHLSSFPDIDVHNIFIGYEGAFAQDTADVRETLERDYEHKVEAAQKAKGLTNYYGQWFTTGQVATLQREELERKQIQEEQERQQELVRAEMTGQRAAEQYRVRSDDEMLQEAKNFRNSEASYVGTVTTWRLKVDSKMEYVLGRGFRSYVGSGL
jgi:hypothetical protein